jgi:hypothetical protein
MSTPSTPPAVASESRRKRPLRHRIGAVLTAAALVFGVVVVTEAPAQAVSCSAWKTSSWAQGWACYRFNANGNRVEVSGQLKDRITDGYCVSFAMRSQPEIEEWLGDGYNWRHHNVACTTGRTVNFKFNIAGVDGPGFQYEWYAVATKETSNGTVLNFMGLAGTPCSGCG